MKRIGIAVSLFSALSLALTACDKREGNESTEVASACQPKHNFDTVNKGQLTVSVYVAPPYTETPKSPTSVGGIDGAIVEKIANMECLTLNAKAIAPAAAIESVKAKRADLVIGGIVGSPERATILGLSDPIYRINMAFISRKGVSTVAEAQKGSIGLVQGYRWNQDFQKIKGLDLKIYQSLDGLMADLLNGRVETGVLDDGEALDALKRKGDSNGLEVVAAKPDDRIPASVVPAKVVLVSTHENDAMNKALNEDLAILRNSGELSRIIKQAGLGEEAIIN